MREIDEIIKSLSNEIINNEINNIKNVKINKKLSVWVSEYDQLGKRPDFLWKWLYHINLIWIYVPVDSKYKERLLEVKFLYNMFIVLIDDVAETKGKHILLKALLNIKNNIIYSKNDMDPDDHRYYIFTRKVWKRILEIIAEFPNHKYLQDIFFYDTDQFLNAVVYANLIFLKPNYINSKEFWLYIPHSMQIVVDFDLDLMCVDKLVKRSIGIERRSALVLQEMGRIGNWVSTWKREVMQNDYTSVVLAYAIEEGVVDHDILKKDKNRSIAKIEGSSVINRLINDWQSRYDLLKETTSNSQIITQDDILEKARYLIYMHLLSSGHK